MSTLQELIRYCNDEIHSGALLLTGEMGCGKTYLIEKELSEALSKTHFIVRVSLLGVDSLQSLDDTVRKKWLFVCTPFLAKVDQRKDQIKKSSGLFSAVNSALSSINPLAGNVVSAVVSCDPMDYIPLEPEVEDLHNPGEKKSVVLVFDDLERNKLDLVEITGGEPMLHPEFHRIYTTLRSMGFIITLNTNGTMITEEMCRDTFREKPRRVNVTLYGNSADTYGRLCHNREGYERTVSALRLLRKYDIDTKLNLSMVRENNDDYDDIMALADELGIPVVSNSYMFPVQRTLCRRHLAELQSRTKFDVGHLATPYHPLCDDGHPLHRPLYRCHPKSRHHHLQ